MSLDILGLSVVETAGRNTFIITKIRRVLISLRTKYQRVDIVEFEEFGRGLILDGLIQSTEADEFIYHESLVHPALTTHPNPKEVLIIGGGEGATLREVLKHNTVKSAVMVDIDGELVELAKKYLDFMHKGSFYDPRTKLIISDGAEFIKKEGSSKYDVVVLDLTDPYGPEIARKLYSREFYEEVRRVLRDDGIMVTQAGSSFFYPRVYDYVLNNVKSVFSIVREYWVWVPAFAYACNFIIASNKYDPTLLTPEEVDSRLRSRSVKTLLYNGKYHKALFMTPILRNKFSKD